MFQRENRKNIYIEREKIINEIIQEDFGELENMSCHTAKAHQMPGDNE